MSTSDECQVPVRDGHSALPQQTAPEEMYWLRHMSQEELSEKLVNLRDDFYTLKKFSCRQEDKIKKLQTKLRKLISDKKKDEKGGRSFSIKEMEYQEALETQQQTVRDLRLKTQNLEKKLKLANIQLNSAKKNKPLLFRHVGPKVDSGLKQTRPPPPPPGSSRPPPSPSPPKPSPSTEFSSPSSVASAQQREQLMPERVREILEEARERIVALEAERDDLQDQLTERQQAAENADYEAQQRIALLEEEVSNLKEELHHQGVREERSSVAAVRAERESHTLSVRTVALQEQLVATEEKVAAEKMRKDALHSELERITEKLLATEKQLWGVQEEQQKTAGKLLEITEKNKVYEKENQQLKNENDRLMTLNMNFEQKGFASENEALKAQIGHLEAALQSDLSERGSFLEHMTRDKENLARAEDDVKQLKERLSSLQEELQKANTKLTVFDKAGLLSLPEKDLTLLQPRVPAPSPREFERLREAHSELQLLYREKNRELEQLSTTLTSHSSTYRALQAQVEKVTQESVEKEEHLNMTVRSLQDTIRRKDERCDKLETQILTLTNRGMKETLEELGSCLTQTVGLGKHDNVLEFHIDRVVFDPPEFSRLKTFVSWTVPFSLEDPLQHTNVARGSEANYNYSALYKFQVNSRNLASLREDTVTVSVYILLDSGHPAKVGECTLTFHEVLDHPRNTLHGTVPVVLAHDDAEEAQHLAFMAHITPGQVIGNMSYWFRLQRPSEDAIAQHLRNSRLQLVAQREKSVHKQEAVATKPDRNPIVMTSVDNDPDQRVKCEQISQKEGDIHKEKHPVPAPRSQKQTLPSPKPKSPSKGKTERIGAVEEPHQETPEHREPSPANITPEAESDSQPQQRLIPDSRTPEKPLSRSGSVSSTGTYSVENPMKSLASSKSSKHSTPRGFKSEKPKRSNSEGSSTESSTGTYNIESPKISKNVLGTSKADAPKCLKSSKSKCVNSETSSESSEKRLNQKSSPSTSSKKSESAAQARERMTSENPEEGPSTSHSRMGDPPLPHRRNSGNSSRTQRESSEGSSDSSLEENEGSDKTHTHSPQNPPAHREKKIVQKRVVGAAEQRGTVKNKRSGRNAASVKKQHQAANSQETYSNNSSKQEESNDRQMSSSEASHSSDSEGVVAVVSKARKNNKARIYIEVSSLKLQPDCGILQDPQVELIFVDYHGFLGLPPDQLETPLSLPKNAPDNTLTFNFRQEFNVDKRQHPAQAQALRELMGSRGILKFTITSEPPEELQDTLDCQDLGYAYVDLHQLAKERQDLTDETLTVESSEDGSQIGVLRVTLYIVQALQHLGLA
ncbi:protein fantom-like isoform X2 [Eriocheir sinensis]|uniref:protein fantom-like isoform X2 n=1 Tax=Eriocheir sinensis TaxID=95602 RepID=UPI0021C7AA2D|nr:protein fantom-like isoform X2 [Eriocheir sinensis]